MKRTTSFVQNFHFGNTVKFMANKTKEFIVYTAECMRAYFGVCDKENSRWKITHRKIISTPLLRKVHYADRKLTISSHTSFAFKNQQEKRGKKKIAFLILALLWKQFLTYIRFQEGGNYPPTIAMLFIDIISNQAIYFSWMNKSAIIQNYIIILVNYDLFITVDLFIIHSLIANILPILSFVYEIKLASYFVCLLLLKIILGIRC